MRKILLVLAIFNTLLFAKPTVTVSIVPQKYFVEQIAQDTLNVNIMVKPGASPATYEPKPKQMSALSKSSIYFAIGVPFENVWIGKFRQMYPKLSVVKTQKGIKKRAMAAHHHHGDEHHEGEHEGHHHGKILDPHVWLDPILVKTQANNIAKALVKKFPKNRALYEKNLDKFLKKLDNLNAKINIILKDKKGKKFLVYHPAWGYFAARYGLKQEAIEIEGKEPKPKALQHIISEAKEDGVHVIFVQPQFSQKSAKVIASAIDGKVVSMNPLKPNWEEGIKETANILAKNLK